jgi:hypothetical protein
MFCSTSISVHLLRGLGALALIFAAFYCESGSALLSIIALVGAFFLMRGCPMCWTLGLFETLRRGRNKST